VIADARKERTVRGLTALLVHAVHVGLANEKPACASFAPFVTKRGRVGTEFGELKRYLLCFARMIPGRPCSDVPRGSDGLTPGGWSVARFRGASYRLKQRSEELSPTARVKGFPFGVEGA
jgi:hypothetical protein